MWRRDIKRTVARTLLLAEPGFVSALSLLAYLVLAGAVYGCDLPRVLADPASPTSAELIEAGHALRAKAILTPVVEAEPSNAIAAWLFSKALLGLGDLE